MIIHAHSTIKDLIDLYLENRAIYYTDDRGLSRHWSNIKSLLKPVADELGHLPLCGLDAPALARLRDQWVRENRIVYDTINRRIRSTIKFVEWCNESGYTTPVQLIGLSTVQHLRRTGRNARKNDPVRSASRFDVDAVLAEVPKPIRAMMQMMELTGMRPCEARRMRLIDLKRVQHDGCPVFKYTLGQHKTSHLGKRRRVFLAGRAFDLAVERISTLAGESLFDPETEGYLFSPDDDGARCYAEAAVPQAIRRGYKRACKRAKKQGTPMPQRWSPNQLRHGYATKSKSEGLQLELIGDLLGHSNTKTTLIYIDDDVLDSTDDHEAMQAAIKLAS